MSSPRTTVGTVFDRVRDWSRWFFGVFVRKQTYYNLLYLLLAFPLGIGYFTVLVTGFAIPIGLTFAFVDLATSEPVALLFAGIPLALVLLCIGVPIALVALFASIELTALERLLADRLLDVEIPTSRPARSVRERVRRLVLDGGTWKGAVYLFSKFVFGTVSFIVLTVGFTFTYVLVAAPFHYRNQLVGIHLGNPVEIVPELTYQHDGWTIDIAPITLSIADGELISLYVDSLEAALTVSAIGVLVGLVVLHLFNALAWLYARYTELLLQYTQPSIFREPPQ
ncbi:sensor domain-containing protein [Natrinema sp. SYSU A 869]|uniref:sensor domain-containing protein n=1 Tax=Natrinema sp. SYSU A 869 TaxID=2871694 RepID=UPI001CA44BC9|nr:sensor domain-containing protein [Natrinema sp. SYSU A 869]